MKKKGIILGLVIGYIVSKLYTAYDAEQTINRGIERIREGIQPYAVQSYTVDDDNDWWRTIDTWDNGKSITYWENVTE